MTCFLGAVRGQAGAAALFATVFLGVSCARAADISQPEPAVQATAPVESGWRFINPFTPCDGHCAGTVYVGRYISTTMSSIFLRYENPPWQWHTKDSTLVSGSLSREILTYEDYFAFETEVGIGKRFGGQNEWEFWSALYGRWKKFPWNDYVRTSVALSTGVNYATDVSGWEKLKSPGHTSEVLHYLSPEITFGLPSQPNLDLVFRFHHRSGGSLGVFNNTGGGSQYQTVGLRYHW